MSLIQLLSKYTLIGGSGFGIATIIQKDFDFSGYFSSILPKSTGTTMNSAGGGAGGAGGAGGGAGGAGGAAINLLSSGVGLVSDFAAKYGAFQNKKLGLIFLGSLGIVAIKYIDFGNWVYVTRNQFSSGLYNVTDKIVVLGGVLEDFKTTVYKKINKLQNNIETSEKNIKLVIKQKSDELKGDVKDIRGNIKDVHGEIKDVKGGIKDVRGDIKDVQKQQETSNGLLGSLNGKLNNVENKTNFISRGVHMLCNSVLNNKSFDTQSISELKKFQENVSL
jgi:gas vesicle protein